MDWNHLIGHEKQKRWFATAIARDRLASTFLFTGPKEIGKRTFAKLIAKTLFCINRLPGEFSTCNRCEGCAQVDAETHPDLILVSKPPDKSTLPLELLIGREENRMREGLCHDIRMKPFYGQRRIAIIDDADYLPTEAANSLLKTLEEPPAGSLIFLIATSEQRQLPTIRSRTQSIRFQSLSESELSRLLLQNRMVQGQEQADALARSSDGTLALARLLQKEETRKLRSEIDQLLLQSPIAIGRLAKSLEGALKPMADDGQARRDYFRMLTQFAINVFRRELWKSYSKTRGDVTLQKPLHPATAIQAINATLEMQSLIDRNLTPAALIEEWVTHLARIVDVSRAKHG